MALQEHYNDNESERGSTISAMRKTKSIDASCLDMRSLGDVVNATSNHMPRAKSEFNLTTTTNDGEFGALELLEIVHSQKLHFPSVSKYDQRQVVMALYSYIASGENQLTFLENDRIALIGERAKGWQFGENLRTQLYGWFPVAYTEYEREEYHGWDSASNHPHKINEHNEAYNAHVMQQYSDQESSFDGTLIDEEEPSRPPSSAKRHSHPDEQSPTRMFGDTMQYRESKHYQRVSGNANSNGNGYVPKPGPPPTGPAPVPTPVAVPSKKHIASSQSFSSNGGPPKIDNRKSQTTNYSKQVRRSGPAAIDGKLTHLNTQLQAAKSNVRNGVTNASLHSSNDSGFANEPPPPQPDVDYSDEETLTRVPIR